jgi:hypothetical protein
MMCTFCPDAQRIPDVCDDWHCDDCQAPCPCHTAPTPERIAAHDLYWQTHVVTVHNTEYSDARGSEAACMERIRENDRLYRQRTKHPCAVCGVLVSQKATHCKRCGALTREARRMQTRIAAINVQAEGIEA